MSGGKSLSEFYTSANDYFIAKSLKESEFQMYISFATEYFLIMVKNHFEN